MTIEVVLDPVCEMNIQPSEAVATATLDGWRRFYFCSRSCYEAFLDLPHAYVGWSDDRGPHAGHGTNRRLAGTRTPSHRSG